MAFADYVKDLMAVLPQVDGNPMLSATSMTDNARYRENPFYRQEDIRARDKLVLDEEERVRLAAAAQAQAQGGQGMMGGGGDGGGNSLDPATLAYLNAENSTARGIRNNGFINSLVGNTSDAYSRAAMGLDAQGMPTPGRMAQMAYQYQNTPSWLQPALPNSYANASGFINQNDSIFSGYNPAGDVPMGAQQSAALAAQDVGLFDSPAQRESYYNSVSDSYSGGGGGAPTSSPESYSDSYSGVW